MANMQRLLGTMLATGQDFALVRYTPSGALDSSFGGDGIVTTPIAPANLAEDDGDTRGRR